MRRESAFAKTALAFFAFYLVYGFLFSCYQVVDLYNTSFRTNMVNQALYLKLGRLLLKQDKLSEVDSALGYAVEEDQLHFYLIRQNGAEILYANKLGESDKIAMPSSTEDGVLEMDGYRFSIVHEGPYELVVGHQNNKWMAIRRFWQFNHSAVLKDFVFVLIGMFSLVLYTFRDLRHLVKTFSKRGARRGDLSIAKSQETLTLVRGLGGYESTVENLKSENQMFRMQVLPALRKELESGRKPPYEFDCTLVRTDINNFTSIFTSDRRQHFMDTINEFFIGITHIVSRYGGSVHEFVGDEVLFYFKDEECGNSSAIAVSALRDIQRLALELSDRTENEADYRFRVKSSIAWGTLRFGPLVDGFSLAGPALIETVRMLSHVHEKSENTVLLDQTIAERVQFLARTEPHQVVMLKGLNGSRHLHRLDAFTPLSLHLRQATDEALAFTHYYRHDEDIAEILNFIESSLDQIPEAKLNKLLGSIRTYRLTKSSAPLRRRYLDLLQKLISRETTTSKDEAQYLLATLISAASHLFTTKEWNSELRETFLSCLKLTNRRVIANTLDVFAELEPSAAEEVFEDLAGLSDNRIAANALVKEGKREWSKSTAKKLEDMLEALSPYFRASGLYALGEIAHDFRKTDAAAFAADPRMQKLLSRLNGYAFHANAMVRRQALKAIWKADRIEDLRAELNRSSSRHHQDLINELRMFMNEHQDRPVPQHASSRAA